MALVRGWFRNADTDSDVIQCHFNPNEIAISRSNTWTAGKKSGSGVPDVTFGGMGAQTLQMTVFLGVITQMSVRFTLFTPEGMPVRATAQVSMQEVPQVAPKNAKQGQNPTSHAFGARRVHVVREGDTIDWIASTELGDASTWRVIAEANNLDDPRRLRPGQRLIIPEDV
jgi:nucleoid-associated protein YgaU